MWVITTNATKTLTRWGSAPRGSAHQKGLCAMHLATILLSWLKEAPNPNNSPLTSSYYVREVAWHYCVAYIHLIMHTIKTWRSPRWFLYRAQNTFLLSRSQMAPMGVVWVRNGSGLCGFLWDMFKEVFCNWCVRVKFFCCIYYTTWTSMPRLQNTCIYWYPQRQHCNGSFYWGKVTFTRRFFRIPKWAPHQDTFAQSSPQLHHAHFHHHIINTHFIITYSIAQLSPLPTHSLGLSNHTSNHFVPKFA